MSSSHEPGLLQEGRPLVERIPKLSKEQAKLAKEAATKAEAESGEDLLKAASLHE